ncbi:hypothetical protein L0991_03685 [Vibrio chagasii]|uniref:hypothetical protein n=1 Tax=Vibrio chagasii TaxID=170679 RepID=UPI0035A5A7F1
MSAQVTFDPRTMSPEELQAQLEKALQIQKDFSEKKEKIEQSVESLLSLTDATEIEIALDLLLPFVTKNIDKADSKLRDRLSVRIDTSEDSTTSTSVTRPKGQTYQLYKVDQLQEEAPTLYTYLVDNEGAKPLESDENLLVVYRKRFKADANEAAKADGFDKAVVALDKLYERELKVKAGEEIENIYALTVTDFNMR